MDSDDKAETNKRISQFLTDNNFPISVEGIKQSTRAIKSTSEFDAPIFYNIFVKDGSI